MFRYTVGKKNLGENVRGQARLIHDTLRKLGPSTSAELTAAVSPNLETRQDPARVVGYYLIVLGKKGQVARTIVADPVADESTESLDAVATETIAEPVAESLAPAAAFVTNGAPGEVVDDGPLPEATARRSRRS